MGRLMPYRYSGENKRAENDQYFTPRKPVEVLVQKIMREQKLHYYPNNVLDPCAGTGSWGNTVKFMYPDSRVYGIDIDETLTRPELFDGWRVSDFITSRDKIHRRLYDLIISNPPFNKAEAFVERGLTLLSLGGVLAYLLPVGFLTSIGRKERLFTNHKNPYKVIISSRRIDFTGQGNPHTDVAMFLWVNDGERHKTEVQWFDWQEGYCV